MNDKSLGIYVNAEKKFYYLESGDVLVSNTIDRLKKTLTQREIIKTKTGEAYAPSGYEIMSCLQAKQKEYDFVPIYISKNIEESLSKKTKTSSSTFK
jgi:hypothetical protein